MTLADLLGMMMGGNQAGQYGGAIGAMARGMGGGRSNVVGQGQDANQWARRFATGQGPQYRQPAGPGTAGLRDFVGNDMWSRAYGQQPRVVGQNFSDADKWRIAQGGWGAQHQRAPQSPQLPPIERHAFDVGDWGGMHAALAARGNRPMGGGYGSPQMQQPQRSLMPIGGGMSSLAALLGGGGY